MKRKLKVTIKPLIIALAIGVATGCSSMPMSKKTADANCAVESAKEDSVRLDLIQQQVDKKQYYAALAYLENAPDYPRVLRLRAESQRNTGLLDDAFVSYQALSQTCMAPVGYAGMAKVLATKGDLSKADQNMLQARRLAPVNADIRNDYGFILLAKRDYKAAQREFMTALQLQPSHGVALRNMIISLILAGDAKNAIAMAKDNQIEASEFHQLVGQARSFKNSTATGKTLAQRGAQL